MINMHIMMMMKMIMMNNNLMSLYIEHIPDIIYTVVIVYLAYVSDNILDRYRDKRKQ